MVGTSGRALARLGKPIASNSFKALMFLLGEITRTLGAEEIGVTPAKSVKVLKGS